ncbi:hypothetical protein SAY86_027687 [Trapa natans]|uniref:Uncharacterized protein n=1 Tax=Trapa natans TaxID=22666 RepID=A0AAN7KUZ2_TRANT|nr:hypothetical protein SAY86_027687 [Trapa natans]
MNMLVSECSSGCESGWTLYLEHSMDDASHRDIPLFLDDRGAAFIDNINAADEVEEEDLSMVSDASSGPPHLHEEEEEEDQYHHRYHRQVCLSRNSGGGFNKKKYSVADEGEVKSASLKCRISSKRKKMVGEYHRPSLLDDTASSPLNNFFPDESVLPDSATLPNRVLQHSNGFPRPDFVGRSALQHQFDTLYSSFSSHQFQKNNQRAGRKKMGLR